MLAIPFRRGLLGTALLLMAATGTLASDNDRNDKEIPADKIRKILDEPITLDYNCQDLQDLANHLKDKTGINFVVDQANNDYGTAIVPNTTWSIKGDRVKLSKLLRQSLSHHMITYIVFEDSVVLTHESQAMNLQLFQLVTVQVEDVPLQKALKDLRRRTPFNLVIDPRVLQESQREVSLDLENTTLEGTVRLLAEMAGLKAVRVDNVLLVTHETRADKVRLEQKEADATSNGRSAPGAAGPPAVNVVPMIAPAANGPQAIPAPIPFAPPQGLPAPGPQAPPGPIGQ